MPHILDDFKKYFILYNKDPNFPEYQSMFENVKQQLNKLSASLFMISNDVDSNTDKINKKFFELNASIKEEKKRNIVLKRKLGIIEQKGNSSDEMFDNFNEIYDMGYLRNWGLFGCIIVGGLLIKNVYTTTQV